MLSQLSLRDFRCFTSQTVELDEDMTVLVGRNAQGKTSLIEAACVLLRLQSPRSSNKEEWIKFGAPASVVSGRWCGVDLRCAVSKTGRRLTVDGAVCGKMADYLASAGLVVWMDHADMNLVRAGAEHRRKLLDFTGSQMFPEYLPALRAYERALRSRNFILKRDAVISWGHADAFARVLATHAGTLRRLRTQLVQEMSDPAARFHRQVGGTAEHLKVEYTCGFQGEDLVDALRERREEEGRLRTSICGVHRDDLRLQLNGMNASTYASEGQQRTLALSLKLSQAEVLQRVRGVPPLVLMDDVLGELDLERRRALLDCLPPGTQKVLTTTHLDGWSDVGRRGRVYEVNAAHVGLAF